VRRAAATAVVRFLDEPARVLALLRERLTVERDDRLVIALVENVGHLARRHPGQAAEAVEVLAAQSGPPYGPGPRLAALGQLAACAPGRLPADLVPTVLGLLGERSAHRPCRPGAAGASAVHSLVDRLRRLRPSDEEGTRLLRTLHTALDDRLPDRIALLHGQLTSPGPTDRCNAVLLAAALFREWRGDHSATVALIGEQLRPEAGEDEGRLRDTAVSVLADLFTLAAPAADRLHALVAAHPEQWIRRWRPEAPLLAGPLHALARSGDARAVPVLAEVLAGPVVPRDLGTAVADLGTPEAAEAAGYVQAAPQVAGVGAHWINWSLVDQPFDPARPSMLLYDLHPGRAPRLAGFSYWVRSAPGAPDGFAGANDVWHRHLGLCFVDGWLYREGVPAADGCPGAWLNGSDLWMLHAWVVPGLASGDGRFSGRNPVLCPGDREALADALTCDPTGS
jgi:hypothetical protein